MELKIWLQFRNFKEHFIKILLQFGSFKIHLMKIQLSFIILRQISENSVNFLHNDKKMRYKQLRFYYRYNSVTIVRFKPNSEGRLGTNSEV